MATLSTIGNFWQTRGGEQYERWLGGCLKAAYDVLNEAAETENHADRLVWANTILSADDAAVRGLVTAMMKYGIVSNATLQASPVDIDDNGILFIIASQLNILAG